MILQRTVLLLFRRYSIHASCQTPFNYFLVEGDGKESRMYVGLRSVSESVKARSYVKGLNEFIKGAWPGLQTELVDESDDGLAGIKKILPQKISITSMH